jgi:hypothetical protein
MHTDLYQSPDQIGKHKDHQETSGLDGEDGAVCPSKTSIKHTQENIYN